MTSTISYGPGVPGDDDLRLCGDVAGKRVIELGLGRHPNALTFAAEGAKAIGVDPDAGRIAAARRHAEAEGVRIELHQNELGDLGFATSASVDLVLSVDALAASEDLPRVLRQVHRVLKANAPLVFSLPHPIGAMLDLPEPSVTRPYWGTATRTVGELFTALQRANFQVDAIVEPPPTDDPSALVPAALVMRARKLGV